MEITLDEKPQEVDIPPEYNQENMPSGDYNEWYDWFFGGNG